MKLHIIISTLLTTILQLAFGQNIDIKEWRVGNIHTKIVDQKKDEKRIELYRFYSQYFTDSNIYPNADAIDLVDAYNKESNLEDIKSSKQQFKELMFKDVPPALKEKAKTDSVLAVKPNRPQNNSFKYAIQTYNQKYKIVSEQENLPVSFKDSLLMFGRRVLPVIHINSYKISVTQMEFFTVSLNDINQLMGQLHLPDQVLQRLAINELMKDFFEFKANSIRNGMLLRSSPDAYREDAAASGLYFAAYNPLLEDEPLKVDEKTELANANVYVYTRGANGKWDQAPKPNSYNVYYGPNGLKYSLTPGCDTLSFFKFRPSVPASTLPVVLAKGNYCFVLQDINTHQLFLRPDINLRDNQVIDDTKLIKLCFKVENH